MNLTVPHKKLSNFQKEMLLEGLSVILEEGVYKMDLSHVSVENKILTAPIQTELNEIGAQAKREEAERQEMKELKELFFKRILELENSHKELQREVQALRAKSQKQVVNDSITLVGSVLQACKPLIYPAKKDEKYVRTICEEMKIDLDELKLVYALVVDKKNLLSHPDVNPAQVQLYCRNLAMTDLNEVKEEEKADTAIPVFSKEQEELIERVIVIIAPIVASMPKNDCQFWNNKIRTARQQSQPSNSKGKGSSSQGMLHDSSAPEEENRPVHSSFPHHYLTNEHMPPDMNFNAPYVLSAHSTLECLIQFQIISKSKLS